MSQNQYRVDYKTAVSITLGATSADSALPLAAELLGLTCTSACHFRTGTGAQTALATDPMLTPGAGMVVIRVDPSVDTHIAAIEDSAAGVLSVFRVFED